MRKNTLLIASFLIASSALFAQNVAINTSGNAAYTGAILDLSNNNTVGTVGFLPPYVTLTNATTLSPLAGTAAQLSGLLVYNTSTSVASGLSGQGVYYWYYDATTPANSVWRYLGPGSGAAWLLTGNAGTIPGTNFLGTTDAEALEFKVDGTQAGWIDYSGGRFNTFLGNAAGGSPTTGEFNTAMGYMALPANTTGTENTAVGYAALYFNTSGGENTASGLQALDQNTIGSYNTAYGWYALQSNKAASQNTAIGSQALFTQSFANAGVAWNTDNVAIGNQALYSNQPTSATNGYENTGVGDYSLYKNTVGNNNVALGYGALYNNVTQNGITAVGYEALYYANNTAGGFTPGNTAFGYEALMGSTTPANNTGATNTALGYSTLAANTSGSNNTATGYDALTSNTTGGENTANGFFALANNTGGSPNTAVGYNALDANTSGNNNVAVGDNTLSATTTSNNTAVGSSALKAATANNNTAVGYNALVASTSGTPNTAVGYNAMAGNTTGGSNAALGNNALSANITGSDNTAVGALANVTVTGLTNATAIGFSASVATSNTITMGNNAVTQYEFNGALMPYYGAAYNAGAAGEILTSQGAGLAPQWTAGSGWLLLGNTGTIDDATLTGNFLGTTDNKPMSFRVDNLHAGRIENAAGTANTFFGFQAGNGSYNCANGNNTAMGYQALLSNTTGGGNTAVGTGSLLDETIGGDNSAVGTYALANTQGAGGQQNTAIGYYAASQNTTGAGNTASGMFALNYNTTGTYNTADGAYALFGVSGSTINNNTAVGYGALMGVNTGGSNNTAVGYNAGDAGTALTTGSGNTFIGYNAQTSSATVTNSTAIGNAAIVTANNTIQLGNAASTGLFFGTGALSTTALAANVYYNNATGQFERSTSSRRYKKDITDLKINTSMIYKLRAVSYLSKKDNSPHFGLIAEEVASVIPQLAEYAREKDVITGSTSDSLIPDAVQYPLLAVLLLPEVQKHEKIIKEQQQMIDSLKANNENLKAELAKTNNELNGKQAIDERKIAELENEVNTMLKTQASIK